MAPDYHHQGSPDTSEEMKITCIQSLSTSNENLYPTASTSKGTTENVFDTNGMYTSSLYESDSESESSPDNFNNQTPQFAAELVSSFANEQITLRDVWMQKQIYLSFKRAYERQQKHSNIVENLYKLPDEHIETGDNKVEISLGSGIFISKTLKSLIDAKYKETGDWKVIVKEMLQEIYGDQIIHFSATGKRTNSRTGINKKLFDGLLEWVNRGKSVDETISKKVLITEINHVISNKRDREKKKMRKKNSIQLP